MKRGQCAVLSATAARYRFLLSPLRVLGESTSGSLPLVSARWVRGIHRQSLRTPTPALPLGTRRGGAVSGFTESLLAHPAGLEPATVGLEIRCSVRLSYGCESAGTEARRHIGTKGKAGLPPFTSCLPAFVPGHHVFMPPSYLMRVGFTIIAYLCMIRGGEITEDKS